MFFLIGVIVVIGSVIGGYLMEHGNLAIMIQPVEVLIIYGAAFGAFFIANPPTVVFRTLGMIPTLFAGKQNGKKEYLAVMRLLYTVFSKMRKDGPLSLEGDIENPAQSELFKKSGLSHELVHFLCDNLRTMVSANLPPHELEGLMETEIEVVREEALAPSHAVARVADALPGLGIVAAVLGVVLTMAKIDQPPEVIGHTISVALLGTFMGILGSYGFAGPIATNFELQAQEQAVSFCVCKAALVAFAGGTAPLMALEFGRRAIPGEGKPSFSEMEKAVKGG